MYKVVKLRLIVDQTDKDGNKVEYNDIRKILWELQKQTREIKNKAIQLCWEYYNFRSDYYKMHQKYPKEKDILSKSLKEYVNDRLKTGYDLYSGNCQTTSYNAVNDFENSLSDICKGTKSIINYKADQPLELRNDAIKLQKEKEDYFVKLNLLNRGAAKKNNFANTSVCFRIKVRDKSTRTILERCMSGEYGIGASKLIYKKKDWYLLLTYDFTPVKPKGLDPEKILGVDLGIYCPICASVNGDNQRFYIWKGEIYVFRKKNENMMNLQKKRNEDLDEVRKKVEERKRSLQKQGKYCGDGRIGHGTKTRIRPIEEIGDKIARFRDTVNHKYSRALIEYAVKNGCGTIQMEDLKGITDTDKEKKFLKNWTYDDLQTKIKYKAEEAGINVVCIKPAYTSQRCSKCGYIDQENRQTQEKFTCRRCEFKEDADYNASQNIAIKDIAAIIEEEIKSGADKK